MNHHELLAALREAGVSDTVYGIATRDLTTFDALLEAVPILVESADGHWSVDAWERGEHWVEASFDSEEDACAYIHQKVMRQWTMRQAN